MTTTMVSSSAASASFTAKTSSSCYSSLRRFSRRHRSRKCEKTTSNASTTQKSSSSSSEKDDDDDDSNEKATASTGAATTTSRRTALLSLGVVVVSSSTTNIEAANAGEMMVIDSRTFVSRAMQKFERNDVEGATMDFDALIEKSPGSKPYLWQRGIALYYVDEFREAEKQFREDVRVNPNDTEEAAWAFLSQMRKGGEDDASSSSSLKKAREEFVELAGRDSRKVMGSVLRLYKTGDEEAKKTLESLSKKPADSTQSASDAFYASLYLGLYSEALGNAEEAKYWVKKANGTPYGQRASGDFMTSVAKVHLARRKWDVVDEDSDKRTTGGNVEVVSTHAFDSATRRLERFPFPESYSMRIV
jgi:predicted Zn-dependent protease